jgi:MFS family permease
VPSAVEQGVASRPGATLAVLTGLNALNYLDRFLTAPLLPLIIVGLALTDQQAGSLQTVFILVYSVVCPVAGWLGDRMKRLLVAAVAIFVWSGATMTSGLAPTFAWLLLARAVVGVGEAGYTVVTPSLLADHYPPDRRGRALAIFYAAMPVGIALGYVLGGQIGERHGWRPAFYVAGGPGLVLAFALLWLREPRRGRYDQQSAGRVAMSLGESLRALLGRPSYFFNMAAQTIYSFTMGGLGVWMPTYFMRERGLGVAEAGTIFGAVLLGAGFLGTIAGGQIGDRLARRFKGAHFSFSAYSLMASVPFTLLAVLAPQPVIFWSAMFATLFLLFMNYGPLNAAMVNVLPPDLRARGVGIHTTTIHLLGDALSPFLIGTASDAVGLRWPVLVTGLLLPLAGVVLLVGRKRLVADLEHAGG